MTTPNPELPARFLGKLIHPDDEQARARYVIDDAMCDWTDDSAYTPGKVVVDSLIEEGFEVIPADELAQLLALRDAVDVVLTCEGCGEPAHYPNDDCWYQDRSDCAYLLNSSTGVCSYGCREEPSCVTDGPYPIERLRMAAAVEPTKCPTCGSGRPHRLMTYSDYGMPLGRCTDPWPGHDKGTP